MRYIPLSSIKKTVNNIIGYDIYKTFGIDKSSDAIIEVKISYKCNNYDIQDIIYRHIPETFNINFISKCKTLEQKIRNMRINETNIDIYDVHIAVYIKKSTCR